MIKEENKVVQNLVTYFMLPMLQLNKSSFGVDNFTNSYLDVDHGYIVVNTKDEIKVTNNIYEHENYVTDYTKDDGSIMYVFSVPEEYMQDKDLFVKGQYSQLSAKLKIEIARGQSADSIITKMLNPQLKDRQKLADELHVRVDLIKEIKSPPSEANFMKIK